jgi:hypothetical protein
VGKAALIKLGRDDPDVVAELRRDPLKGHQARGMDAVIVGDENTHYASIFSMSPM